MTVVLTEISNQPIVPHSDGDDWEIRCGLTLSGTYKTGGDTTLKPLIEAIIKEQGAGLINFVIVNGYIGYVVQYNYATGTLMVFEGAAGALKELAEAEYPAALREAGKGRMLVAGS